MVLYDYRCDECEHTFEARRSLGDKSPQLCPSCDSSNTRRSIGMPAVHLNWWNARASSQTTPPKNFKAVRKGV